MNLSELKQELLNLPRPVTNISFTERIWEEAIAELENILNTNPEFADHLLLQDNIIYYTYWDEDENCGCVYGHLLWWITGYPHDPEINEIRAFKAPYEFPRVEEMQLLTNLEEVLGIIGAYKLEGNLVTKFVHEVVKEWLKNRNETGRSGK